MKMNGSIVKTYKIMIERMVGDDFYFIKKNSRITLKILKKSKNEKLLLCHGEALKIKEKIFWATEKD